MGFRASREARRFRSPNPTLMASFLPSCRQAVASMGPTLPWHPVGNPLTGSLEAPPAE